MNILILTQYFPPESGAPQNRLHSLATHLVDLGTTVQILTAMPNYPKMEVFPAYRGKRYVYEKEEELTIHRAWIYVSKSKGLVARLLNYFSFVLSSMWYGFWKVKSVDLIICESPPLFLGITALWLKMTKRARLLFNVSDLWPESAEKLGLVTHKGVLRITQALEEFIYRKSDLISGQTQGIAQNIGQRMGKEVYWLRNGADVTFFQHDVQSDGWRAEAGFEETDFILLYAGILGHAQGLEVILQAAEQVQDEPTIQFVLMGTGPEEARLKALKAEKNLTHVHFFPNRPRHQMAQVLADINAAMIPLKKLDLFLGAIPSKIFEAMFFKKPILLGIDGEARTLFIENHQAGLYVEPENAKALAEAIKQCHKDPVLCRTLGENGYRCVMEQFNRKVIAEEFWAYVQKSMT